MKPSTTTKAAPAKATTSAFSKPAAVTKPTATEAAKGKGKAKATKQDDDEPMLKPGKVSLRCCRIEVRASGNIDGSVCETSCREGVPSVSFGQKRPRRRNLRSQSKSRYRSPWRSAWYVTDVHCLTGKDSQSASFQFAAEQHVR